MASLLAIAFWQRLDRPGSDACRLLQHDDGWQLKGHAVFDHDGDPAALRYTIDCNHHWHTRKGRVEGWIGRTEVDLRIDHPPQGNWKLNGTAYPALADCVDLDLAFTPATNVLPLRRLRLPEGRDIPAPAAYLNLTASVLDRLDQTYRRLTPTTVAYAAPAFGYAAHLEHVPVGFITDYPNLWRGTATPFD